MKHRSTRIPLRRAAERKDYSRWTRQPHLKPTRAPNYSPEQFFVSTVNWLNEAYEKQPPYQNDSRKRDIWLRDFVMREPHLAGVVKSVVDIDKNRGWRLVGGRNQTMRFKDALHNSQAAPDLYGWRPAISVASRSFWTSDLGAVIELGRDGRDGPVRAFYTVDPTRCKLTGNARTPLRFYPGGNGKMQDWTIDDYFRVVSMPNDDYRFSGLGFCAVSRAISLAELMLAVYQHDHEMMSTRAPRGILLLEGIGEQQFQEAMIQREEHLDSIGYDYFGKLAVLASNAESVDAKMIALSELPESFNLREWMDMLLYGYALCFGYDASEFWPVQYGALGRGNEGTLQHEKATGKGRLDFVLGYQEQLQYFLPESLEFQFDQRDESGDLMHAQINQAWAEFATKLYMSESMVQGPLLSKEQTLTLLADYGVIPRGWVPTGTSEENDLGEDLNEFDNQPEAAPDAPEPTEVASGGQKPEYAPAMDGAQRRAVSEPIVLRPKVQTRKLKLLKEELATREGVFYAAKRYPDEPIVQYNYPGNTMLVLWERGADLLQRSVWNGVDL